MPRIKRKVGITEGQASQRQKLVDEFVGLDAEVSAFRLKILRHEKLRALILNWYTDLPPDEEVVTPGTTRDVHISARDKLRTVSLEGRQKLLARWGQTRFLDRCVVYLRCLPDPEDRDGAYTEQAFTGPRHLKVVPKRQPEKSTGKEGLAIIRTNRT